MRKLTDAEEDRLVSLTSNNAEVALLEITQTGLDKSIMDATHPLRRLLHQRGFHDYGAQAQGTGNKVMACAVIHGFMAPKETKVSLYRPDTKEGDPRIWFYGLKEHARSGDILAIIPHDETLHLINLSEVDVPALFAQQGHSISRLLHTILRSTSSIADELLDRLRELAARGPTRSVIDTRADTAIGRTLEHELGIAMNSLQAPDYKGIELKSYRERRAGRQVRKTLFAQVPDWSISKLKRSAEILDAFGYERDGAFKLYCQVEATKRNSQGLQLRLEPSSDMLWENSDKPEYGDFAAWPLDRLRSKLLEKHAETFWIAAKPEIRNGTEYFQFTEAVHTRKPIASQFDILIEQGVVSMDHLIKRKPPGSAKEKGPLFKIEASSLNLLFPAPRHYDLLAA
ncbi:MvaI/BcnI family restriction endonuclease [Hyphomonas sp. UBA4494]|uniref:MvaI/BcnI family restriction endonuclease n=1 Tax=Hyphomonas sp. UBA4494 TaxID=1946631 RepID=UPI0025C6A7C6|nr:MvaI/BcnI family restriction endonuclease [Hyphomonas sp. UBA4494]